MKNSTDETSRKGFYLKYFPLLVPYVYKFVDELLVEDIVHEAFIKLWSHSAESMGEVEQRKLLYVITRNLCIDYIRRQTTLDTREIALHLEELQEYKLPDDELIFKDRKKELQKAIDELPEQCRQVIRMYYMENRKTAEIAELLNLSGRTVENHLYRAIQLLRKKSSRLLIYLFLIS